jgi:hypothetical protein
MAGWDSFDYQWADNMPNSSALEGWSDAGRLTWREYEADVQNSADNILMDLERMKWTGYNQMWSDYLSGGAGVLGQTAQTGEGAVAEAHRLAQEALLFDTGSFVPDHTYFDETLGKILYEGIPVNSQGMTASEIAGAQGGSGDMGGSGRPGQPHEHPGRQATSARRPGRPSGGWMQSISDMVNMGYDAQGLRPNLTGVKSRLVDGVIEMANAAKAEGLTLTATGIRSEEAQERLFNDRYKPGVTGKTGPFGDRIWNGVTYRYVGGGKTGEGEVAVPGTSYHATGDAIDIGGPDPDNQQAARWRFFNRWGNKAGIYRPLMPEEPWHWERIGGARSRRKLQNLFTGGMVGGAGSAAQMIMAHGQEFVMNAAATRRIGMSTLNNMNNYAKFTGPTGAAGGTTNSSSSNVTIYVDTFVGERGWFEKMMNDYNINIAPSSERARGIEKRTVGSYTERNTRSRV